MAKEAENTISQKSEVRYDITFSFRMDPDTKDALEKVALFEHVKVSELIRKCITTQILKYKRNPQFKAFLRELEKRGLR